MVILRMSTCENANYSALSKMICAFNTSMGMAPCGHICDPYSVPGGGTPCGTICMMYCAGK